MTEYSIPTEPAHGPIWDKNMNQWDKKNLFEEAYSGYKAGYNANLSGKNLDKTKQKQLG